MEHNYPFKNIILERAIFKGVISMHYGLISLLGLGTLALKNVSKPSTSLVRADAPMNTASNTMTNEMNDSNLQNYVNDTYQISFKYPKEWRQNPRYENKYEGKSGFFEIGDYEFIGGNIDEAVQRQVNEDYKPYGLTPTITKVVVDGEPAREIISSADQGDLIQDRDAALVIQYKKPILIGDKSYQYLVIWTTKENLPLIASTFKFTSPQES